MRLTAADIPLLVLAGGKATRLAHLAKNTAKYVQPITESVNFSDVHLRWIREKGFRKVFLSIGHLGEQVREHCGDGSRFGLEISYLADGAVPLGTGGAVKAALQSPFEILAVTYGDTVLNFNVESFLTDFQKSGLPAGMTLFRNTLAGHVCNADLNQHLALYDKDSPHADWLYIDYGFLIFRREAVGLFPEKPSFDLAEPVSAFSRKSELFGFAVANRFWEIGSPEALEEFRKAFPDDIFGSLGR
jgi:N-acetyl-alpha-D-muramate 1-phosphate uridylyltransferase